MNRVLLVFVVVVACALGLLASPAETAVQEFGPWEYTLIVGANGRFMRSRGFLDARDKLRAREIDLWTYTEISNGRGPALYERSDKLGAVLASIDKLDNTIQKNE